MSEQDMAIVRGRSRWRWAALPLVPVQAAWLIRTIERFPDADGVTGQVGDGDRRMKVVALGDSVTVGYAIEHHRSSVVGQLARLVSERFDATVDWEVHAVSGYTAGEALDLVSDEALHDADLIFVSVGVNDLKGLHTTRRFRRELAELLDAVLAAAPRAKVCLLGIAPLEYFPAFPVPLADLMGLRGKAFNAVSRREVAARDRMYRIDADQPLAAEMFGPDGFHPSAMLHAAFAEAVMEAVGWA